MRRNMVKYIKILLLLLAFSLSANTYSQAGKWAGFGYKSTCPVEAQKYIDSAVITDATHKTALCNLVQQLKDSSLYSLFDVIYPMEGGTSSSTKWNLIDPRNLDAAYRITWTGGLTYSATGVIGNGTNGVGDTHFAQSSFTTNNEHVSVWCRTNVSNNVYIMGNGSDISHIINPFRSDLGTYAFFGSTAAFASNSDLTAGHSVGFSLFSRTSSSTVIVSYNGSNTSVTNNQSGSYSGNVGICSLVSTGFYAAKEVAFASIGKSMTAAQCTKFYNIVQAFITATGK